MIITEQFVYIHQPKTGGTFVETVVARLYPRQRFGAGWRGRVERRLLRVPPGRSLNIRKHGWCSNIPWRHRGRRILATVRNPFDRYVSEYEYRWWQRYPEWWGSALPALRSSYPGFPDLPFEDYVRAVNRFKLPREVGEGGAVARGPGFQTCDFVLHHCRHPRRTLRRLAATGSVPESIRADLFHVTFARTDRLNDDLCAFLRSCGLEEERVSFVRDLGRVQPPDGTRRRDRPWQEYYSEDLRGYVREIESALFELFPEFDT